MTDKIKKFLESDLLEKYLLDTTTTEETLRVERYIAMYPEVSKTYNELQENLETFAKLHAIDAPDGLKNKILERVKAEKKSHSKFYRYIAIACSLAFVFAAASFFFWNQNKSLQEENTIVNNKMKTIENNMKQQLEDVRNQFIVLNNPKTKRYNVKGNTKAKELKAVAYINPVKKLSYINVKNIPNLPEDQCLQMWAEVDGKMINIGIIKDITDKDKLLALPYGENAMGYITIEPKGGNKTPTVENIVANISYAN
ncbi:anti-sigma factor [Cellulophaga lytica]|uniref:anti-sigma factor n=1 Tax=Cellulophaga lytica TaxID=979 RepID=UPI0026E31D44|nr:anti-sigma factor [Cellulophaga lytica]MDO6854698.1 anti-sigma factor [Cellulophaga lytica]